MSSSSVEKIKENLDVEQVIGAYVKLEKAGGNYKGRCPFHNEKSPSFFVSPGRGTYYCFGCGAKGDIFTFVQEFEGLDFVGALKMLAEKAGVTLEEYAPKKSATGESLHDALESATKYFEQNLKDKKEAIAYLKKRGLNDETIAKWRLGYALPQWRHLSSSLKAQGISNDSLLATGLIKKSDTAREDGFYDVFRGRIVFPIFDSSGKVIAFSGRIFDDAPDAPKYLNSPETALFFKSETLYGLNHAKMSIRKKDFSMLVEGQMDLLMCHQAGFDNAVASSGTAFTEGHLLRLKRLSNRILFVFDGDSAGFAAALKSATLAMSLGLEVKLSALPEGEDPADLILKDPEVWSEKIKQSKHVIDFHLDQILAGGADTRQLAKQVEQKILPYVAQIVSSIEQSHFVSQIAKRTGIREEAIWNDLRRIPRGTQGVVSETGVKKEIVEAEVKKRKNYIERRLYGIIFWQESLAEKMIDVTKLRVKLLTFLKDEYLVEKLRLFEKEKEELVFEAEAYFGDVINLEKEIEELLANFEEDILKEQFTEAMMSLNKAESNLDEARQKELLTVCQDIGKRLSDLSKKRIER